MRKILKKYIMSNDISNRSKLSDNEEKIIQKVLSAKKYKLSPVYKLLDEIESFPNYKRLYIMVIFTILATAISDLISPTNSQTGIIIIDILPFPLPILIDFLINVTLNYFLSKLILPDGKIEIVYQLVFEKLL